MSRPLVTSRRLLQGGAGGRAPAYITRLRHVSAWLKLKRFQYQRPPPFRLERGSTELTEADRYCADVRMGDAQ